MITVDTAVGSKHLEPLLRARGASVKLQHMEFADIAFEGHGPGGGVSVGIELKNVRDLVDSMRGRLAGHQIPGLINNYGYIWLIVEGRFETTATGYLNLWGPGRGPKHAIHISEVHNYLTTLQVQTGLKVLFTVNTMHTVREIIRLYLWWQKPWDRHSSLKVTAPDPDRALFRRQDPWTRRMRKVAMALSDGIGWNRSKAVAETFDSVIDMVTATSYEWKEIEGIGAGLARSVTEGVNESRPAKTRSRQATRDRAAKHATV